MSGYYQLIILGHKPTDLYETNMLFQRRHNLFSRHWGTRSTIVDAMAFPYLFGSLKAIVTLDFCIVTTAHFVKAITGQLVRCNMIAVRP